MPFPLLSVLSSSFAFPFLDPSLPIDKRVDLLVDNLTLQEKIHQMQNAAPSIPRLNIPSYDWWSEALHGIAWAGNSTVFPQSIGLASTFDPANILKTYQIISDEARAKYHRYIALNIHARFHGLTFWTPNINIFRDPRWGRGQETFGEDPFLTSVLSKQVVNGLQGDMTSGYYKTHGCAKHFAVHSGPESLRHRFDVRPSDRDLNQTYLVAFKELVESGVAEVMCAYNRVFGQPACANDFLKGKLQEWNFKGMVTSDCGAIDDFWMAGRHGTHHSAEAASADAVLHGTTIECGSQYESLLQAVQKNLIKEKEITQAVKKLFWERFKLGMFDPPELIPFAKIPYSVVQSSDHDAHALQMARESIVLLQNDGVLPIAEGKRVLVIGPNADNVDMLWGNYNGFNFPASKTILAGLQAKPTLKVDFTEGCDHTNPSSVSIDLWQSINTNYGNQTLTGFTATFFNNTNLIGPPQLTRTITRLRWHDGGETSLAGGTFQSTDYSARFTANFTANQTETLELKCSVNYGMRVKFGDLYDSGNWQAPNGVQISVVSGTTYLITVEYYHGTGESRLNFAITRRLSNDFASIETKAANADVIVFVGGITSVLEGEEKPIEIEGFSGGDRTLIELPKVQRNLLEYLKKLGRPIVFVICAGSAIAFDKTGLNAVLDAFYPGQAGGTAVADVLVGDYNPAGKLPITFYSGTTELPDFTDYNMSAGKGRTYRYYKGVPLYPFGFGLSYTTFEYSEPKVSGNPLKGEKVTVSFGVRNTGQREGEEVVQVYVKSDIVGEPIKSLKYFKRQNLQPSSSETKIEVVLEEEAFAVFHEEESHRFTILVGGSSGDGLKSVDVDFGSSKSIPVAAIVGGVVGGVVLIAVIVGLVCFIRRRRKSALELKQPRSLIEA